ncbi:MULTISPECIES: phage protein NinX family protein [Citrobacter]|uniref:phage protein NinX family protein n=1 Tax=Citrobacter TaxID=544 RepID=UPI00254FF797|nr:MULTISPECIES: phage protein NinX family protein [Citrobacter]MDM3153297.1 DUF2591 family protein [Citrobacter sp. Cf122]
MDYSKLSDHEINVKVGSVIGFAAKLMAVNKQTDYCNNPADAWQVIVENGIGIKKQSNGMWCATRQGGLYPQYHENPLRAAMVVYLQMQD